MICLDTSPVIWGVQSTANKSQTELISRMGAYLRYLKETRIPIMVPSPVVFEYLVPFNKEEKPVQIELIERLFIVPSFDLAAAAIAAELTGNKALLKDLQDQGANRQKLRIDAQIVAIAIAQNAEKIISHDPHLKSIAQEKITVDEIPIIEEQGLLFSHE